MQLTQMFACTHLHAAYVSVILTHVLYYAYESIRYIGADHLPWELCNHSWNTLPCVEPGNLLLTSGNTTSNIVSSTSFNRVDTPAWQYYDNYILRAPGLGESTSPYTFWAPGGLVIHLLLALIVTWGIVYFAIFLGALLLGKMLVLSVIVSMSLLLAVFIRGVTLPGKFKLFTEARRKRKGVANICIFLSAAFWTFTRAAAFDRVRVRSREVHFPPCVGVWREQHINIFMLNFFVEQIKLFFSYCYCCFDVEVKAYNAVAVMQKKTVVLMRTNSFLTCAPSGIVRALWYENYAIGREAQQTT